MEGRQQFKNRRTYACFDLWTMFYYIPGGLAKAITRLAVLAVVGVAGLMRVTQSAFPAWVERYLLLDTGANAFESMVLQVAVMNNPVQQVACWELMKRSAQGWSRPHPRPPRALAATECCDF